MGLTKKMKDLTKEYMNDPRSQYFRHLKKILELHKTSNVTKKEVLQFVEKWGSKNK